MISTIVGFHKPEEPNGYLSNWYMSEFVLDSKTYCCVEQYMMEQKALLFGDKVNAEKIMNTRDPQEMQNLGKAVGNFNPVEWDGRKQLIIYKGLLAKFSQNPTLASYLINAGDVTFAECARLDKVWGIGRGMDDDISDPNTWRGQNLLGFALTEVKKDLIARGV